MKTYAWGIALAAWGLLLPALVLTPPPPPVLFAAFVALAVVAEWLVVPLPRGGYQSAGVVVVSAALLLIGSVHMALVLSLGVAIGNGLLHRRPSYTVVFNSGQYVLSALTAGVVFSLIDRPGASLGGLGGPLYTGRTDVVFLLAFFGAIIAYVLTSSLFATLMIAHRKALSSLRVFLSNIGWELVNNTAFATLGLLVTLIYVGAQPPGALILTVPLALVGAVLMHHTSREQAHRELEIVERVGRASMALDLEQLFEAMYGELREVLSADAFYVAIADGHGKELCFEYLIDSGERFPRQPCDQGETLRAILRRGEPVLINRTREEMARPDAFVRVGRTDRRSASLMFVPVRKGEEIIGLVSVQSYTPFAYTESDLRLLEAIARQAAVAIENARLLAQTQRRAAEVDLLNRMFSVVSGTLNPEELFRRTAEEVATRFGYSHVGVYRREGQYLVLQGQVGYESPAARISVDGGILGRVVRTAQPVLLADVTVDRDYIIADPAVRSEAAVPIVVDNEVQGVLNVEAGAERVLGEGDLQLLQMLARQLAVTVRNATLYDEVKRTRDELSVLYEAAKAISSSLEVASVLETLVQVACRAFGYEYGAILLADERSGDLIVEAIHGYPPATLGFRVASGKGITGWVQRMGKPQLVNNVGDDPRHVGINPHAAAEMAVPLIREGRVIGVFNVESTRPGAFGERDLNILTALASYATIAIQNARLFEQTEHLAITDGLTELFNHRYLHEAMDRMLERCSRDDQPLGLIMLEIDHFKRYNDTYGHRRGDEVLRIVADLLRKGSRASDLVARYGGDEFMIVLPEAGKETASEVGERLRRAIEAYPFVLGENIVTSVTLSVGIAASPDDGVTVDALVDAVDRAQYSAKRSGGNKVQSAHVYH